MELKTLTPELAVAAQIHAPDLQEIENRLLEEKVNKRAQRYLRDLRRDAVIEYS